MAVIVAWLGWPVQFVSVVVLSGGADIPVCQMCHFFAADKNVCPTCFVGYSVVSTRFSFSCSSFFA